MTTAIDRQTAPPLVSPRYWLFSAPLDLAAFLGSALLSLLLLAWGGTAGLLHSDTPEWTWVPLILLIDVAHVYATGFRVYFDRAELTRRPLLYGGVPAGAFLAGIVLYQGGELLFWRVVAYLAVFHFVRQQYGWVALYRRRLGEPDGWERWLDTATIYLATLYPLLYWHAHLPRRFWWFLEQDFQAIPRVLADAAAPVYWGLLALYAARAVQRWVTGRPNPGKDIVVATTAFCWHVGIITFNSDYAFTVTNVIIHGVPYIVLVYWYVRGRRRQAAEHAGGGQAVAWRTAVMLLGTIWVLAYAEELVWDRAIWQERSWLFGGPVEVGGWHAVLVPLLAVPQLTHYILDGVIWKRKNNPNFTLRTESGSRA